MKPKTVIIAVAVIAVVAAVRPANRGGC